MNVQIDNVYTCLFLSGLGRGHSVTPPRYQDVQSISQMKRRRTSLQMEYALPWLSNHHHQLCSVGVCVYLHTRVLPLSSHHEALTTSQAPTPLHAILSFTQHVLWAAQWCSQCRWLVALYFQYRFSAVFFTCIDYSKLPLGVNEYEFSHSWKWLSY